MSDSPRILLLKEARAAGLTRPVSKRVPIAKVELELRAMLADLMAARVPAALVQVAGEGSASLVAIHRLPCKQLRPSWDFKADGTGPNVNGRRGGRRQSPQSNFNHA